MPFINVEIKARTGNAPAIREYLLKNGAWFKGTDLQTDTYFNVTWGRLKLREGNIETNLIWYERANQAGPKQSNFHLFNVPDPASLKAILTGSLGVKTVVSKKREIYYIRNVKFHIDELEGLGSFVEIEAGNKEAGVPLETLQQQCDFYMRELGIGEGDLLEFSYSDMLMGTV